jgi:small subunit ribosomal protein S1
MTDEKKELLEESESEVVEQTGSQEAEKDDQSKEGNIESVVEKKEEKEHPQTKQNSENEKEESSDIVVAVKDLKEEKEYSDEELSFLTQLYDKTLNTIKQGDIVRGKVLDITDAEVVVDIGFKSEGIIPMEEFDNRNDIKVGEEVEVFLETVEDMNGQLILSRRRADFIRVWEEVVEKFENNETIKGTISRRIKGGMVVTLNGVDAFLPGSQIDVKPIRDFDSFLGKEMEFRIVKVNHARRNIVVSSRVLIEKEMDGPKSLIQLKKVKCVKVLLKTLLILEYLLT